MYLNKEPIAIKRAQIQTPVCYADEIPWENPIRNLLLEILNDGL